MESRPALPGSLLGGAHVPVHRVGDHRQVGVQELLLGDLFGRLHVRFWRGGKSVHVFARGHPWRELYSLVPFGGVLIRWVGLLNWHGLLPRDNCRGIVLVL